MFLIIFLCLVIITSLYFLLRLPPAPDSTHLKNLKISHRGDMACGLENTLSSIKIAKEFGADAVEVDVRITKDKEFVIIHDDTLQRTTNGFGFVKDMTLQEIKKLNIIDFKGKKNKQETIPTLEEIIKLASEIDIILELEIKNDIPAILFTKKLKELVAKYNMEKKIWVNSFHPTSLFIVRKLYPEMPTSIVLAPYKKHSIIKKAVFYSIWLPKFLKVSIIHPFWTTVKNKRHLDRYHEAGLITNIWLINTEAQHQWLQEDLKQTGYMSDCVGSTCKIYDAKF